MMKHEYYYKNILLPKLISTLAIDNKTPVEACRIIQERLGLSTKSRRRAYAILTELEKSGDLRKDPVQPARIHVIVKERGSTHES